MAKDKFARFAGRHIANEIWECLFDMELIELRDDTPEIWDKIHESTQKALLHVIGEAAIDIVRKLNRTISDHIRQKEVEQWVENRKEIKKKRSALIPANQRLERANNRRERYYQEQPLEFRGNNEMEERMKRLGKTFCEEAKEEAEEAFVDEDTLASFISWLFRHPLDAASPGLLEHLLDEFRSALGKDNW